jgi:tRNA (mo5U34)-methyltransferase
VIVTQDELETLRRKVNSLPWFHQLDLGDGILTPGRGPLEHLKASADAYFTMSLDGKSVLDVGCFDGFNSFEAMRRGAARVLAADHFIWHAHPHRREAFELARSRIAPDLRDIDIDVLDMTPERVGTFDIVLFAGVLYHLRNPFLAIERVASLARETLIVETHLDALDLPRPAMVFYPTTELNNDPTNWWGPNPACVVAMLKDVGFSDVAYRNHPVAIHRTTRGIFHARR